MSRFITDRALSDAITALLKKPKARCAVAFWGQGSENIVRPDAKVICNLKSGGSNPHALKKLRVAELRQCDRLHAKVYLVADEAIVCSANASANGLGMEGAEATSWIEAGIHTENVDDAAKWFATLWRQSRTIEKEDWAAAVKAWKQRQTGRPTALSFADYNVDQEILPVLCWSGFEKWDVIEESVKAQLGFLPSNIRDRMENGIDIDVPADVPILRDRWVLCWPAKKDGTPRSNSQLHWTHLSGQAVQAGAQYQGADETTDVLLASENAPPIPFDPTEEIFVRAFRSVLARPTYLPWCDIEYGDSYFPPRMHLLRPFWRDLKQEYLELKNT